MLSLYLATGWLKKAEIFKVGVEWCDPVDRDNNGVWNMRHCYSHFLEVGCGTPIIDSVQR